MNEEEKCPQCGAAEGQMHVPPCRALIGREETLTLDEYEQMGKALAKGPSRLTSGQRVAEVPKNLNTTSRAD